MPFKKSSPLFGRKVALRVRPKAHIELVGTFYLIVIFN